MDEETWEMSGVNPSQKDPFGVYIVPKPSYFTSKSVSCTQERGSLT